MSSHCRDCVHHVRSDIRIIQFKHVDMLYKSQLEHHITYNMTHAPQTQHTSCELVWVQFWDLLTHTDPAHNFSKYTCNTQHVSQHLHIYTTQHICNHTFTNIQLCSTYVGTSMPTPPTTKYKTTCLI